MLVLVFNIEEGGKQKDYLLSCPSTDVFQLPSRGKPAAPSYPRRGRGGSGLDPSGAVQGRWKG